ncbi:MAG: hypothetical protein ACSHWU_08920, partial [Marinicella sp.]
IPFTEENWEIQAKAHVIENYAGEDAIYIQAGSATLKNTTFLNGTIEFDVYLTERQSFPGVRFRAFDDNNMESFFLRPHLSGKPDANQAVSMINGLTGFQLYFGDQYSFSYDYNFDGWTHVKLVVNDDKAQVFLDQAKTPHLSWVLKHKPRAGKVAIGGGFAPMHYANFTIDESQTELIDFAVKTKPLVENIIEKWQISDQFEESELIDLEGLLELIEARTWEGTVDVEDNSVANISWAALRYGTPGNTVLAKINIKSKSDQVKIFEFGYSDRAVAILNGVPIYKGTTKWRTRDYRYLGTVGLFDAIYLNLKKGDNELVFAVSEDFGGWGITGRFTDPKGLKVKP